MIAVEFPQQTVVFAKNQPEYNPLPAHVSANGHVVTSCWKLTPEEWDIFKETRCIFLSQCTFGSALQPIALSPEFNPPQI